jgi:DNA-binding CsgD family transcriptional regulator
MLAVTEGRLSQLITGLLYCGVITTCQKTFAFGRAQEWTAALTEWCDAQPELVTFQGECRVHRSEVLQFGGEWQEALEQAERAATDRDKGITGHAWYQKAEIQRLRGEIVEAEQSYLRASQLGREPQPGLCLLRAASGQSEAARATLRRLLGEARDSYTRCTYLSAAVEILTTCGATEEARTASEELDAIAAEIGIETLEAVAAQARGRVLLSEGDAPGALGPLRRACFVWQQLGAPYLEARVQVDLGRACRALGDEEGAELLLRGARASFERLGAADTTAVSEARVHGSTNAFGLTARELEVLRLVATGATNKTIAGKLGISEKTVDRHVSNLFSKLKVSTRAGATSLAHEQKLL